MLDSVRQCESSLSQSHHIIASAGDMSLKRKRPSAENDSEQLLGFLHFIQAAPQTEVEWVICQIPSTNYPISALESVQQSDLVTQQLLKKSWNEADDEKLRTLDATALRPGAIGSIGKSAHARSGVGYGRMPLQNRAIGCHLLRSQNPST